MTSLDELAARLARIEQTVEALDEASAWDMPAAGGPAGQPADDVAAAGPVCADVGEWVDLVFRPTFSRPFGGDLRWCPRWQEHDEAVLRLEALWRAWEQLRLDPTMGMATWLRDHLDPQLAVLFSQRGPFARCTTDRHEVPPVIPTALSS